ncbi:hypothetical protein Tco_0368147 [Tanacetum coccineum]
MGGGGCLWLGGGCVGGYGEACGGVGRVLSWWVGGGVWWGVEVCWWCWGVGFVWGVGCGDGAVSGGVWLVLGVLMGGDVGYGGEVVLDRKAHLLEDKKILSEGVFDEVFSTWMTFGGNTVTWAHLEKKRTRLRTYTKSLEDLCIQNLETASGRGRLKEDLESSTWRRRQNFKATPSCGDPNHLIEECPKPPKDKNQIAFVGGSWSDCDEEDDEKVKDETYLVAQESNELCSESYYFSDENSSIDDLVLDNEYDKLCKMSLKIITKNKRLKAARNSLEKELSILKEKVSTLEKNKGVNLECVKCHVLKIVNEKLKEEAIRLTKFEKSTHCLNETLSNKKPIGDKFSLGFNSCETSTSKSKEIKFVKSQKETSSGGGPQNTMGGPLIEQTAPKVIMGPPVRIRQISQENRQKRANTDTRTEECARAGSQSQKVNPQSKLTLEDKDPKVSNSVP